MLTKLILLLLKLSKTRALRFEIGVLADFTLYDLGDGMSIVIPTAMLNKTKFWGKRSAKSELSEAEISTLFGKPTTLAKE
ncbi:MAG TPA: hypothetical protein PLJ62_12500 [Thermoflexales bacterium]|nr:hypothetical protein [Thermoflexales bacterium]HQW34347.1 hypothetical protein [Thermoflexales bacterium]HRA01015.1 hypothetical protein [Thermoflexales bacterium]